MGWLWLLGSSKLQVSSAEDSPSYRALLQKNPMILTSLLIAATPYRQMCWISSLNHIATHCNTLQHTFNSLQHTAGRYFLLARPAEGDANGCLESFLCREESTLYVSIFIYVYTHTQVQVFFFSRGLREVMPTGVLNLFSAVELQAILGGGPALKNSQVRCIT